MLLGLFSMLRGCICNYYVIFAIGVSDILRVFLSFSQIEYAFFKT